MKALTTCTLFWILWFNNHICLKCQERNFRIKLEEFSVKYRVRDLIEHIDFRIVHLNNRSFVNGEMILKSDVEDILMHTAMDFWKASNKKKLKLYDGRMDACKFLRTSHRFGLFNIYVKSFRKHTNANFSCPLKMNYSYTLTNWHMDERDLPPFVPFGTFRTITEYFTQDRLALRIATQGKVIANKLADV
ncbi:uncharacterized protein LOC108032329 [Drosophila biarmipes]|uniref:uncharacterized protein LOC108032329 n=1 Tax=Drosophila biarmipes TaxID=125945 RepID=UPI0007E67447|nr:uncharacterized protein LOC108032329 [Drosophila biarmipes]